MLRVVLVALNFSGALGWAAFADHEKLPTIPQSTVRCESQIYVYIWGNHVWTKCVSKVGTAWAGCEPAQIWHMRERHVCVCIIENVMKSRAEAYRLIWRAPYTFTRHVPDFCFWYGLNACSPSYVVYLLGRSCNTPSHKSLRFTRMHSSRNVFGQSFKSLMTTHRDKNMKHRKKLSARDLIRIQSRQENSSTHASWTCTWVNRSKPACFVATHTHTHTHRTHIHI